VTNSFSATDAGSYTPSSSEAHNLFRSNFSGGFFTWQALRVVHLKRLWLFFYSFLLCFKGDLLICDFLSGSIHAFIYCLDFQSVSFLFGLLSLSPLFTLYSPSPHPCLSYLPLFSFLLRNSYLHPYQHRLPPVSPLYEPHPVPHPQPSFPFTLILLSPIPHPLFPDPFPSPPPSHHPASQPSFSLFTPSHPSSTSSLPYNFPVPFLPLYSPIPFFYARLCSFFRARFIPKIAQ